MNASANKIWPHACKEANEFKRLGYKIIKIDGDIMMDEVVKEPGWEVKVKAKTAELKILKKRAKKLVKEAKASK